MKPYSEDLRMRIVKAVEEGMSKSATARLFDISLFSVKRYIRSASCGESLARERVAFRHRRPPKPQRSERLPPALQSDASLSPSLRPHG